LLKLIVFINPNIIGIDLNLDWFDQKFPTIGKQKIINYGLDVIDNFKDWASRRQIAEYLIKCVSIDEEFEEKSCIMQFIMDTTVKMFDLSNSSNICSEFSTIS